MLPETPSIGDILRKRSYVAALERQVQMRRSFGLAFYAPHYKQDLFHQAGVHKSRYGRTANRFGKSIMGGAEDCSWALGYRPFYQRSFNVLNGKNEIVRVHDPVRDAWMVHAGIPQRNVKGLIIVTDWDKAEEIFTNRTDGESRGKLFKLLPEDQIVDVIKNQSGKICTILVRSIWGGVSSINLDTVKSFKSNRLGQESSDWDFVHVDEPCPEEMFIANARGLVDRDGSEWFTCTPLTEMWINDYFFPEGNIKDECDEGRIANVDVPVEDRTIKISRWTITGSMHDNPTLGENAKAKFISQLSEEDKETRIYGRPRALAGAVYREFQSEVHIYRTVPHRWSEYDDPPRDYCIRIAADTHPVNPHAVLFAATAPTGHVFYWCELYVKDYIKNLCSAIHDRLNGRWPLRFLLELAAYNENPIDGITIADEFIQAGFPVEPATKDLQYGILRVKQELSRRDERGNAIHNFSPYLTETIREFDRYVWNPETGKPVDAHDHMMENLYRLVLTGLEYVEPENAPSKPVCTYDIRNAATKPLDFKVETELQPFRTNLKKKYSRYNTECRKTSDAEREFARAYTKKMAKLNHR